MVPKTLRQYAGVNPATSLDPAHTALLVIDFQVDFFTADKLPLADGAAAMARAADLIRWADSNGISILYTQHSAPSPQSPIFAPGSPGIAIHPAVAPKPHHRVMPKQLPSSFQKTDLQAWLAARGTKTLVMCGLMNHICLDSTAREAQAMGYETIVASDACATRDIPTADGKETIPHHEVLRLTLAVLADKFAEVLPTKSITELPLVQSASPVAASASS